MMLSLAMLLAEELMKKIQRISQLIRIIFQLSFIVSILFFIWCWSQSSTTVSDINNHGVDALSYSYHYQSPAPKHTIALGFGYSLDAMPLHLKMPENLNLASKLSAIFISALPELISLLMLYFLIKLFRNYERAEIFSLTNVKYIRYIGLTLLLYHLLRPIFQTAMLYVLTPAMQGMGPITLSIGLSGFDVGMILVAIIIILNSWIISEGYQLQQEQQYTV